MTDFYISADTYTHYQTHYNNTTYRAITDALNMLRIQDSQQYGEYFYQAISNLVIDASFERSGADFYRGAEQHLLSIVEPVSADLAALCRQHLDNFGEAAAVDTLSEEEQTQQAIRTLVGFLHATVRRASDLGSWRGRAAFYWLDAASFLLHAADTVLSERSYDSYVAEKLDRALLSFQSGVLDAAAQRFCVSQDFLTWIRALIKARD